MDRSKFIEHFWWCQRRLKKLSEKEDVTKAAYFRFMTLLGELALHVKGVTNCSASLLVTCNEAYLILQGCAYSCRRMWMWPFWRLGWGAGWMPPIVSPALLSQASPLWALITWRSWVTHCQ